MMPSTRATCCGFSLASRRAALTIEGSINLTFGLPGKHTEGFKRGAEAFVLGFEFADTSLGSGFIALVTALLTVSLWCIFYHV